MHQPGVLSGEFDEHDHVVADVNEAGDGLALRVAPAGSKAEGEREEGVARVA